MNYIVYETINLINHKVYFGVHHTNIEYFDGYLGSGMALKQAVKKYGRNNFKRIILKVLPFSESGKQEAFDIERKIVNKHVVASKYTYNLSLGGQGEDKLHHTLCKSVYQFDLNGNLIKCYKSATIAASNFTNPKSARVAICNVCTKITRKAFGFYWSYTNKFDYKPYGTSVAKYNDEGVFLKSYKTIKEAALDNNIGSTANIIAAIRGSQKRCGGFRWRYFNGDNCDIKPL